MQNTGTQSPEQPRANGTPDDLSIRTECPHATAHLKTVHRKRAARLGCAYLYGEDCALEEEDLWRITRPPAPPPLLLVERKGARATAGQGDQLRP